MSFPVTVGAQHHTLIQFFLNPFPTSGVTLAGNTKVFLPWISVMEFESFYTAIVTAMGTSPAFIGYGHHTNLLSTLMNGSYEILASVAVFPLIDSSQLPPPVFASGRPQGAHAFGTAGCSTIELPGNERKIKDQKSKIKNKGSIRQSILLFRANLLKGREPSERAWVFSPEDAYAERSFV